MVVKSTEKSQGSSARVEESTLSGGSGSVNTPQTIDCRWLKMQKTGRSINSEQERMDGGEQSHVEQRAKAASARCRGMNKIGISLQVLLR